MPLELHLKSEEISEDDLVNIFRLFCEAFKIDMVESDEHYMRTRGITLLRSRSELDYRPCLGTKFFGQEIGNSTRFHGYSSPVDSEWKDKDKKFQELVLQYMSKKSR